MDEKYTHQKGQTMAQIRLFSQNMKTMDTTYKETQ